jgi:hypothetical protein
MKKVLAKRHGDSVLSRDLFSMRGSHRKYSIQSILQFVVAPLSALPPAFS